MGEMIEKHIGVDANDPNEMPPAYSELASIHHEIRNRRAQSVASTNTEDSTTNLLPSTQNDKQNWFSWWSSTDTPNNGHQTFSGYCRCSRNDDSY